MKLQKRSEDSIIKSKINLLKLNKEDWVIKDRIIRNIRILFYQEDDTYKLARVGNFKNNNYIKYENNGDRNKKLSVKEHLNKNKFYLRIGISFVSSKDVNEEHVMHSRSNNTQFKTSDNEKDVDELFKAMFLRY